MSTSSKPTPSRAPAGFPLAIRDYLKRTALLMEIENHKDPFFPEGPNGPTVVAGAHVALFEQIKATFPGVDPFVCVVLRKDDPNTRKITAVCSYSAQIGEVETTFFPQEPALGEVGFDVYRYLRDAANARTNEGKNVRSAITGWLGNSKGHFYIAPYLVTAVADERVDNFRNGVLNENIGEQFLPLLKPWSDFLHSDAYAIDPNSQSALPAFSPYFTAAMLVGVRDWGATGEPADFTTILEALFIQYQLAWSWPALMEKQQALRVQKKELLRVEWEQKCFELGQVNQQSISEKVHDT